MMTVLGLLMPWLPAQEPPPLPVTQAALEADWAVVAGDWSADGVQLEQRRTRDLALAFRKAESWGDVSFRAEFCPLDEGPGVRAAILACRSLSSQDFYFAHFDSKNSQVILVRSDRSQLWNEIIRRGGVSIPTGQWSTGEIRCAGDRLTVLLNGQEVLAAADSTLQVGVVGLGTSQGHVLFRNLRVQGEKAEIEGGWRMVEPSHVVVCSDAGAGGYEAFPDVVRLQNGDLLCVMYAGYGHVSLPNEALPKGGRVCAARSRDNGETWSPAQIVYDDAVDNRDPHIAQLSDGTLMCTFFSLSKKPDGAYDLLGTHLVRSFDGGRTWEKEAVTVSDTYACSAPVREQPDGSLVLGLYYEKPGVGAWGAVTISTDKGQTWSAPIDIGRESGHYHDAETDTCRLANGDLLAVMRPCMCCARSSDGGRTWTPSQPIGFEGHAAYLLRTSTGVTLVAHRLPGTALHYSTDEGQTWHGPVPIDTVGGAYPSLCELPDGRVFCVYYEEGEGSDIRGKWLGVSTEGVSVIEPE